MHNMRPTLWRSFVVWKTDLCLCSVSVMRVFVVVLQWNVMDWQRCEAAKKTKSVLLPAFTLLTAVWPWLLTGRLVCRNKGRYDLWRICQCMFDQLFLPTCSISICCCASCSSCSAVFRERSKRPFSADRRMLPSSVFSFWRSTWGKGCVYNTKEAL